MARCGIVYNLIYYQSYPNRPNTALPIVRSEYPYVYKIEIDKLSYRSCVKSIEYNPVSYHYNTPDLEIYTGCPFIYRNKLAKFTVREGVATLRFKTHIFVERAPYLYTSDYNTRVQTYLPIMLEMKEQFLKHLRKEQDSLRLV